MLGCIHHSFSSVHGLRGYVVEGMEHSSIDCTSTVEELGRDSLINLFPQEPGGWHRHLQLQHIARCIAVRSSVGGVLMALVVSGCGWKKVIGTCSEQMKVKSVAPPVAAN